ncbi:MAG: ClpP family protease [Pseudohongiellaceae bacterium]
MTSPQIFTQEVANTQAQSVYTRLYKERAIFLHGFLEDVKGDEIAAQLIALDTIASKEITLYLSNGGGDLWQFFAIIDAMAYIKSPVSVVCIGGAFSAGAGILASGKKGRRFITSHSRVLIHQASGGAEYQTAKDLDIRNRDIQQCNQMYIDCLAKNTGKTKRQIVAAIDRDNWMTAREAVRFGLADAVITKKPQQRRNDGGR